MLFHTRGSDCGFLMHPTHSAGVTRAKASGRLNMFTTSGARTPNNFVRVSFEDVEFNFHARFARATAVQPCVATAVPR